MLKIVATALLAVVMTAAGYTLPDGRNLTDAQVPPPHTHLAPETRCKPGNGFFLLELT